MRQGTKRGGFGLGGPGLEGIHEEGVGAAEAKSPENATGEGAAAFAGDENVCAGGAFGEREVAVLFDDELAAKRNHEEDAEPSAEKREREDAPEGEFGAEAEKDERGNGEHDAGGERFARGAGGLDDVVFENGGTAEGAENADGQNRDGNGGGDGKTGAEADVHGDSSKQESEERAEDDGANGEFGERFFGGDVSAKFARRGRGTPGTISHISSSGSARWKRCAGIMPQGGCRGKGELQKTTGRRFS